MLKNIPSFAFVIDTDRYAGGFERKLCAYVTGEVGECGVGDEEAQEFKADNPDNPFEELIQAIADENGCHCPVAIWPTPGWFNNSMGSHFRENDETAERRAQEQFRGRCLEEASRRSYASEENNLEHEREWRERSERPFTKAPAYQSVAIFLTEQPSLSILELLQTRVNTFCRRANINLIGFRLLKLSLKEEVVWRE